MNLQFQKATDSQHDQIYDLMQTAFAPYVKKLDENSVSGPYPWLRSSIQNGDVYVALEQAEIVGIATTSHTKGVFSIDQLGVNPTRQGNGIGSWLLGQIAETARKENAKIMQLQTAEMMGDLLRLYQRHGFVETHKALPAHGEDKHLRVHMEKRI